mmetsp:Transcript_3330/g.14525  ORF Transcript_3330/g.14525 Transcript_3330/m.14525 type:complete len:309 (+) Transcript_3330:2653-3579(+)
MKLIRALRRVAAARGVTGVTAGGVPAALGGGVPALVVGGVGVVRAAAAPASLVRRRVAVHAERVEHGFIIGTLPRLGAPSSGGRAGRREGVRGPRLAGVAGVRGQRNERRVGGDDGRRAAAARRVDLPERPVLVLGDGPELPGGDVLLHLVRQGQKPVLGAHLANGLDQTGEVQHVAFLEEELRGHRAEEHVAALHGHQVQAVETSERRDGLVDDGGPGGDHGADGEGVLRAAPAARVAARPLAAREKERGEDEDVGEARERDGHAVHGEVEHADGPRVRVPLAHHALHDEVGGRADQGARAAEDGRE